ncbi:hypothetical protein D3C80_1351550 [compost metagenome]
MAGRDFELVSIDLDVSVNEAQIIRPVHVFVPHRYLSGIRKVEVPIVIEDLAGFLALENRERKECSFDIVSRRYHQECSVVSAVENTHRFSPLWIIISYYK